MLPTEKHVSLSRSRGRQEKEPEEGQPTRVTSEKVDTVETEQQNGVSSRVRPFQCLKCGAAFLLKQHLKRHEKSHIGRHACGKHERCEVEPLYSLICLHTRD